MLWHSIASKHGLGVCLAVNKPEVVDKLVLGLPVMIYFGEATHEPRLAN